MWELDCEESWAPKNWCLWTVVLKSLESPLNCKEIQPVLFWRRSALGFLWKEWCYDWNSSILTTSCEELTHLKRLWCWGSLGAGGEGDDRGWDGWMASLTRWAWVWVNSGSWWWTGRPGMLWFMGSQRVGHNWGTELNWTCLTLCNPMDCSRPCFPVFHYLLQFAQIHVHWPTLVFLPGESQGQRILVGFPLWGRTELDMLKRLSSSNMSIESMMPSNQFTLCHPLVLLPSVVPSIRVLPMSQLFTSGGQNIGASAPASVFPRNIQALFPLGLVGFISLYSKELSSHL